VDFNDLDTVRALVTDNTVAVLLEPVQGEGGVVPATSDFMKGVRALCDEYDLLMLCDEVQCGMGRTGEWFGFQNFEVRPDAFSVAKALGSGYPIGAVVSGPKVADVFQPGTHASTFGGGPLACAAALATIEVIEEEGLLQQAKTKGETFRKALQGFAEQFPRIKEVRGLGLMVGMELDRPAKPFTDLLTEVGLLTIPTAETVVRFLPPLNVKDNELEEALEIIEECLDTWQENDPDEAESVAAPEPAGEEHPLVFVGAGQPGVFAQDGRVVILGVHGHGHQPHLAPDLGAFHEFELHLRHG
jgi:acetylornithine/N-succinyldiaminopimelate aminotransferase